jgi:hypothetical protein
MPSSPTTAATHVQRRLLPALAVSIVFAAAAAATPAAEAATHHRPAGPPGWAGRMTHRVPPPPRTAILPPVGPVRADVAAARVGAV